jgi:hypothetical protein
MGNITGLIAEIESYSGNQLRRKDDLFVLVRLVYSNDRKELFEELCFSAKYVQGLFRVLEKAAGNTDIQNVGQIKADLTNNLEKVKQLIEQILADGDDRTKAYFSGNYLQLSQSGLFNLRELLNDLEWTKKYLNQVKRTHSN